MFLATLLLLSSTSELAVPLEAGSPTVGSPSRIGELGEHWELPPMAAIASILRKENCGLDPEHFLACARAVSTMSELLEFGPLPLPEPRAEAPESWELPPSTACLRPGPLCAEGWSEAWLNAWHRDGVRDPGFLRLATELLQSIPRPQIPAAVAEALAAYDRQMDDSLTFVSARPLGVLRPRRMYGVSFIELWRGRQTVLGVAPGSSADSAGLRPGDELVAVDGATVRGPFRGAVDRLTPSKVKVTLMRGGKSSTRTLRLRTSLPARELGVTFDIPVDRDVDHVAYVAVDGWNEGACEDLRAVLKRVTAGAPAPKVILSLQKNPGGAAEEALCAVSMLLGRRASVQVVGLDPARRGSEISFDARPLDLPPGFALVVLVDGATASASELFVSQMRSGGLVPIIGEETFGKGTVGRGLGAKYFPGLVIHRSFGVYAQWDGRLPGGSGILPDVKLPGRVADLARHMDPVEDAMTAYDGVIRLKESVGFGGISTDERTRIAAAAAALPPEHRASLPADFLRCAQQEELPGGYAQLMPDTARAAWSLRCMAAAGMSLRDLGTRAFVQTQGAGTSEATAVTHGQTPLPGSPSH